MAFDGIVIANLVKEFSDALTGGKIAKITQTERDELLFTIKNFRETKRLLLSVNASLPLAYLTDTNKQGPMTAPNFCMLLRKHIGSGRIVSISQPGLERCIHFEIEHLDEMGDLCRKLLIVELMGKYSNIIFCSPDGTILDSIKHISVQVSSVREVLPGRQYFLPQTVAKQDPLTASADDFAAILAQSPAPAGKAIYTNFTGISPVMAEEFCYEASIDADRPASELNELERTHLGHTLELAMESIKNGQFSPCIVYREDEPMEFAALPLASFPPEYQVEHFDSISKVLETYYASKNVITRIRQKSSDLRRIVQSDAQDRCILLKQRMFSQVSFELLHQLPVAFAIPAGPAHIGDLHVSQFLNGQATTSYMLIRVRPDSEILHRIQIFCKNFFKMIDFSDFG